MGMAISKCYSSYSYEWILTKLHHNVPYGGQILACAFFAESSNFQLLAHFLRICLAIPMQSQWECFFASSPKVLIGF